MAFTKLFSSIITSTIWMEKSETRIVWITMLALADKNGEVQGSVPGLARMAGVSVDECREALTNFLNPDPDSRTKDDEGRRIEEIDGGWLLLNYAKYRKMASKEEQIEKATARTRRYREAKARNGVSRHVYGTSTPVHAKPTEAEAEAEAEANTEAEKAKKGKRVGAVAPSAHHEAVVMFNSAARENGWPEVQSMNPARSKALAACLRAVGGTEGWRALLDKATQSDFLMGRTTRSDDHANWRFNFDFMLMPKRYTKIMEGGYDNSPNSKHTPERGLGAALAALAD